MRGSHSLWIGVMFGIVNASACSGQCLDDGLAWNQDKGLCMTGASATESASASDTDTDSASNPTDSATNTMASNSDSATDTDSTTITNTDSNSNTNTDSNSATDTDSNSATNTDSAGPGLYCEDKDMDGFGDPNACTPVDPGDDPPPGTVDNSDDCDDTDGFTFPGSAPLDDPAACMTDADDDDHGDDTPSLPGVTPGTDCDDGDAFTFPGSAPLDDPDACMTDADDDDYGDDTPSQPGVIPGTDCADDDPFTFPGAAEEEDMDACMTDADEDGWGDTKVPGGVDVGSDCYDNNAALNPGNSVLFTAIDMTGDIAEVDITDGSITVFATVDISMQDPYGVISNAVSPIDGRVYGSQSQQDRLVHMDYCSGAAPIELMPHNRSICGLAFDPAGVLYGIDSTMDQLVTFDTATGLVTDGKDIQVNGQDLNIQSCGMAYDCVTGNLLVTDGQRGRVISVDPATGAATQVAKINNQQWSSVGLEYDPVLKQVFTNNGVNLYQAQIDGSDMFMTLPNLAMSINDLTYGPKCP